MLSLAWPWMLLALPLPFIARALLPEANRMQEAGLRVPVAHHVGGDLGEYGGTEASAVLDL